MHLKEWLESRRIENSVKAAKKGAEKLVEINKALSPAEPLQNQASSLATLDSSTGTNRPAFEAEIPRPTPMPQPKEQALHSRSYTIVGGTMIGTNPGTGVPEKRGRGKDQ